MPASGADPAEQVLAGMWLALLASAMWYLIFPIRRENLL
jgi:hypothetical protein